MEVERKVRMVMDLKEKWSNWFVTVGLELSKSETLEDMRQKAEIIGFGVEHLLEDIAKETETNKD